MKKLFSALLLLLLFALPASAEFRWGPTVGVNGSSLFWKQKLIDTRYRIGGQAGIMGEVMIPGIGFGIDFALKYNLHGARVNFGQREIWSTPGYGNGPDGLGNENVWLHTIEIPLNLRFKWTRLDGLERIIAPFAYAGPVFGFTVGSNDVPAIEYPAGYVAVQVGGGAEFWEHWQVSGGYYWGVSYQVRTVKLDNFSARPQGWTINVAYLF